MQLSPAESGRRTRMTVAQAGADTAGEIVKAALPIPVLGNLTGWAVAESVKYLTTRAQAAFYFKRDCQKLKEMLESETLQQVLTDLDKITDVKGANDHSSYRNKFDAMCKDMWEVDFLLARAEAASAGGWAASASLSITHSVEMRATTALHGRLFNLCERDSVLQLKTACDVAAQNAGNGMWPTSGRGGLAQLREQSRSLEAREGPTRAKSKGYMPCKDPIFGQGDDLVPRITQTLATTRNIGIVGMAGIGKTAVAHAVLKCRAKSSHLSHLQIVWLEVGREPDLLALIKNAFDQLFRKPGFDPAYPFDDDAREGLQELQLLLEEREMNVLLVLDDVWLSSRGSVVDALNFVTKQSYRRDESRLIVTTRQHSALSYAPHSQQGQFTLIDELEVFVVPPLSTKHARQLFHHHAFGEDVPGDDPRQRLFQETVSRSKLDRCGNNPRSLVLMGGHLKHRTHDEDEWWQGVETWRQKIAAGEDDATQKCEDSVDHLPPSVKECFIAFAGFRLGESISEASLVHLLAMHAPIPGSHSGKAAARKLHELVLHSLVSVSSDAAGRPVYCMHRILHGVAKREAMKARGGKRGSLRSFDDNSALATQNRLDGASQSQVRYFSHHQTSSLHAALGAHSSRDAQLSACILSKVQRGQPLAWPRRLRYLHLGGDLSLHDPHNPNGTFQAKLHVLQSLCLAKSKATDSMLGCLIPARRLLHLDLSGCASLTELPTSIGGCSQLMYLDLSECENLESLPDELCNCSLMSELDLRGCCNLRGLPHRIGACGDLMFIMMSGCSHADLTTLPESMCRCSKLVHFDISKCASLSKLPYYIGDLKKLLHLGLSGCSSLTKLPTSIGSCESMMHLHLNQCSNLTALPGTLGDCGGLAGLHLTGCAGLQTLPESISGCFSLTQLELSRCSRLRSITQSITGIESLMHLSLSGCAELQTVPQEIGRCSYLEHLDLSKCTRLTKLPQNVGTCRCLTYLNLSEMQCLVQAQHLQCISGHSKLAHLDLSRCKHLEELPPDLCGASLTHLDLSGCISLTGLLLPAEQRNWQLARLSLMGCDGLQLQHLNNILDRCKQLTCLDLSRCTRLNVLPKSVGGCSQLSSLSLRDCTNLYQLSSDVGGCALLTHLDLSGCSRQILPRSLPEFISSCSQLAHVSLSGCLGIKELPACFSNQIRRLDLSQCTGLVSLGKAFTGCSRLACLNLGYCSNLKELPDCIRFCIELTRLDLQYCSALQELPEAIGYCLELQKLTLEGCPARDRLNEHRMSAFWELPAANDYRYMLPS